MNKSYHINAEGDDCIHVVSVRLLAIAFIAVIALGVAVAFLQGGAV